MGHFAPLGLGLLHCDVGGLLEVFELIGLSCGWSAISGQGQSAYVRGGVDPDDTFAGHTVSHCFSAVSVAWGAN